MEEAAKTKMKAKAAIFRSELFCLAEVETRWVQDEASLTSALENAGLKSEVKFSEGSTATELSNVEDLIEKGMKSFYYMLS